MSQNRISPKAGHVRNPSKHPKGSNGRPLCRQCGAETTPPRRTFCSDACVDAWKITTNPVYVRQRVWDRDHGVCAKCGLDTDRFNRLMRWARNRLFSARSNDPDRHGIRHPDRFVQISKWTLSYCSHRCGVVQVYANPWSWKIGHLWEANHIVPVVEGGGECGLEGYETLCLKCHKQATKELAGRRAAARKESREKSLGIQELPL